ncbi:unnamed protein product [Adineta ricciae]|uniref:J domain-containing protein n=1 Tax=Adineta ricciae TaxID=249248 RepID=A0A815NXA9_ADIRI|nr:unnamed protein product [Adineta ricciae]
MANTPYKILGADLNSNDFQLRIAYLKRIHELKSDRERPTKHRRITPEHFRLICRAYETLSDHEKRRRFDEDEEWTSDIDISNYTLQQLAAEPDLANELKNRLHKAKLRQINERHPVTGQTPLYCAARACNIDAVYYLIEQGANPDIRQRTGSTALHAAAFFGHAEMVRCLLESGADYRIENKSGNLPERESHNDEVREAFKELKETPFVKAANDQLDWFKSVDNGVSHIDTQYHAQRQTLLQCACKKGHFELAIWFIEERRANLDIVDINLNSALHLAAYGGHTKIVRHLLYRGANPTLVNKWGMTSEQEGFAHGTEITDLFRDIRDQDMFRMAKDGTTWWFQYYFDGKSPNATDERGTSLLYIACRFGQIAVAEWLLDNGANINAQTKDARSTPLHGAAYYNHLSTVELLLSRGADTSIKNKFNTTPYEEATNAEIKRLLERYRQDLAVEKVIPVHLYGDGKSSGDKPIATVQLEYKATIKDLIEALPDSIGQEYRWFSVARSPLNLVSNDIGLLSAVYRSRHVNTKFIDLPLCLIAYTSPRYKNSGYTARDELSSFDTRDFEKSFSAQCEIGSFKVEAASNKKQTFNVGNIQFDFEPNCTHSDVPLSIRYIFSPDPDEFRLPGCIFLFEIRCKEQQHQLKELPTATIRGESNAKLYTWLPNSGYWFSHSNLHRRLSRLHGKHAFIREVEVVPKLFSLLPDMFIQVVPGKLFHTREHPIHCEYLKICEPDLSRFPHTAYHGTSIKVIRSILMDGLVMPSTIVSSGLRVCPPPNHIARGLKAFGKEDFANAIFVSPSIHYCSDPVYAVTFPYKDQQMIAVLDCRIRKDSFDAFPSTVKHYKPHPDDDVTGLEWRLQSPSAIQIVGIIFIPVITSRTAAVRLRANKLGVNPNDLE